MVILTITGSIQGMQFNPGQKTIESELMGAMTKAGAISAANAGNFNKVQCPGLQA